MIAPYPACRTPQKKHRTFYLPPRLKILSVHFEVDAERGAIVLADRVNGRRIAEAALVFGQRIVVEKAQALLGFSELLFDEPIRIGAHHALRKIEGLNIEKPVPGKCAPLPRDMVEQVVLRNDVEDRSAAHLVRVIEAHPMQYARAAIVAGGIESVEAKCCHDLNLILGHRTERIAGMIITTRRLFRIPVAAEVR